MALVAATLICSLNIWDRTPKAFTAFHSKLSPDIFLSIACGVGAKLVFIPTDRNKDKSSVMLLSRVHCRSTVVSTSKTGLLEKSRSEGSPDGLVKIFWVCRGSNSLANCKLWSAIVRPGMIAIKATITSNQRSMSAVGKCRTSWG